MAADRRRRRPRASRPALAQSRRFNVAADRRRRRQTRERHVERPQPELQRGRRPSSAETKLATRLDAHNLALQRGRRPSSAETSAPAFAPRNGAALQRGRRPSSAETRSVPRWTAPTGPCGFNVAADRRRRRPRRACSGSASPTTSFNVAADRRRRRLVAEQNGVSRDVLLQRGRRPSSAETSCTSTTATRRSGLQRGRRPSSAETLRSSRRRRAPRPLQRGRRPSSAETSPADRRPPTAEPRASTWPPTVVGGDR